MPPFLGQGMCSGVRDAVNLAWKMSAVVRGANESLLDTYQPERSPHVQRIVESAVGFGRIICTLDPQVAAERDRNMLAARAANPVDVGEAPQPSLSGSSLIVDGAGYVVSDGRLDGVVFDEVLDGRWAVVVSDESVLGAADRATLGRLDALILVAKDGAITQRILDNAQSDAVVVRPDRIVLGTGRSGLDALARAVEEFALVP
jgi:3-(3-hydroxy-phenyl)propionate hydroxylase